MWNQILKDETNELIYKTKTDSRTQKTNTNTVTKEKGRRDNLAAWD